ncbi:hypothetical protein PoB_001331700 [Plakobranchus ocellatus]|uniref:Uncharacterized protein n=1 Tax=Plakobranchus ocellatus TaxID=259542 RepID=A0AAV3YXB6_9GAST|nr:hypothetical protein PoB_001331700 [Plakobranchus ocellatus]
MPLVVTTRPSEFFFCTPFIPNKQSAIQGKNPQAVWNIYSITSLHCDAVAMKAEMGLECKQWPVPVMDPTVFSVFFDVSLRPKRSLAVTKTNSKSQNIFISKICSSSSSSARFAIAYTKQVQSETKTRMEMAW